MNEVSIILNAAVLIAVIVVGFVFANLIKSQKDKIDTLEKYSNLLGEYTKIFDLETVKKYVNNKEELMKQDLELERRKVIKETVNLVTKDLTESIMNAFPKETSLTLEELVKFVDYILTQSQPDKNEREKAIVKMFPHSHKAIIGYMNQIDPKEKKQNE